MSTQTKKQAVFGFHVCIFEDCPGGGGSEAWHLQAILSLIHLIKQMANQKKWDKAIEFAHELGSHRVYAPSNLVDQIDAVVGLIPGHMLEPRPDDEQISYEGT